MKITLALLLAAFTLVSSGCTQQERARNYGGTATEILPVGKKLITLTWKEDHLWYLVRERRADEKPEVYDFKESSSFGLVQGTVHILEH